ncbi:flavin monoamine oxidase family protein [Mucilaginibacter gotjawali]|uniref:Monoamine oxidase n=1 Tax=Mucilaginibacter gotjawali TaxID=1550579 RepID=A0A839S8D3_9SPHI|nr:NAD(P)/FAD-dependent oxidoreductase [Mucilaginibacter gotjawali]MBB3054391.1 monoamine oxidase [Mucilaginibacter gotjawali]
MAHYPIARLLRSAFCSAMSEDKQAAELYNEYSDSRRKFLKQMAITAGAAALTPGILSLSSCGKSSEGSIAIIGAGIAGLNAAYQLQKADIKSTIYEASDRIGGRMFTLRDEFGKGLTTDIGGEFVDTTHTDILQLTNELGLSLYDLRKDELARKTFYFGGKRYNEDDLKAALKPFVAQLVKDIKSLPDIISYKAAAQFEHLDKQTITGYLSAIGIKGWLFDFLNVTLTREYGMEASVQSAVNFLIMFEAPKEAEKGYALFGSDHEVFKIQGGSSTLTDAIYQKVKGSVKTGYTLKSISKADDKGYNLEFDNQGTAATVQADHVIIAIPFTMLRLVRIDVPFPAEKTKCINEIGYGNSSKFIVGVKNGKPWRLHGQQGYTFTDLFFGCGWDSSQMQSDTEGSFTIFGGGNFSDKVKDASLDDLKNKIVPELNAIFPGMDKAYTGKNTKFCWSENPYSKAGYSSFKAGQWSTLAGWEGVPVGEIYFAGEHVSREFQGYMNGGAQTGRVAAEMLMKSLAGNG